MSHLVHWLFLGLLALSCAEDPSVFDRISQRLGKSGKQSSITGYSEPPTATSYLNHDLNQKTPHKINLSQEINTLIRDWTPRLLALDPSCPYYFSKLVDPTDTNEDLNLLSYLLAVESNKTLAHPFVNILPQSYRNAVPLLSIFRCSELVYGVPEPFFHNVELIIGPGNTELPFQKQSDTHSQLYCSLNGSPRFVLVDQSKQSTTTTNQFDAEAFLADKKLNDASFISTTLEQGNCLFIPSGWVVGAQLNNSISLSFTVRNIDGAASDEEPMACSHTGETTIEHIDFVVPDKFNMTDVGLVVYFYQYLNPPIFDQRFNNKEFFERFQNDRNLSQLVMNWTPDLIELVNNSLFHRLDLNGDGQFSIDDYFQIKQSNLGALQKSVLEVLEKLRQIILVQYNDLSATVSKFSQYIRNSGGLGESQEALGDLMANLPDPIKQKLAEQNIDLDDVMSKLKTATTTQAPATAKPNTQGTTGSTTPDTQAERESKIRAEQEEEEEEEVTAEPAAGADDDHHTDL